MSAPAAPRPKLIYCAERHPSLDPEGFIRRWRQHGRLGMSMARWVNIHRYVHCDPLSFELPPGVSARPCDGVALLWYRSEAARQRHIADQDARAIMKRDETETFARPVAAFSLMAEEVVYRPAPEVAKALFLLFTRRADIAPDRFAAFRRDVMGPRILRAVAEGGYTQNFIAPVDRPSGLVVDGIDEISVADPATLDLSTLGKSLAGTELATLSGLWTSQAVLHQADHS